MACNCKSSAKETRKTIHPGDSCIFCTEKHLSLAYTHAVSDIQGSKALIIGELELARLHSMRSYPKVAAGVWKLIERALSGDFDTERYAEVFAEVLKAIDATNNGKDVSTNEPYEPRYDKDKKDPAVGILCVCAAWRLFEESGYEHVNRPLIIGYLTMAQLHLYKHDYAMAEELRDVRHLIQRVEYIKASEAFSKVVDRVSGIYDTTNISWYLTT